MTTRLVVLLAIIVSLAVSGAEAATHTKKKSKAAPRPGDATASSCRGANLFHCGPIYFGADYLGDDPDPFIRAQIRRDLGQKYLSPD